MILLIVAHDEKRAIGKDNKLLCKLKDDMRIFKMMTEGHTVVMGRKTFESIGKPLENRTNVILTRNDSMTEHYRSLGCYVVHSVEELIEEWSKKENEHIFVIGGEEVYKQFLPHADYLYISKINHIFEDADAFFPEYSTKGWETVSTARYEQNDGNEYPFTFKIYKR